MSERDAEPERTWRVVLNDEEQYSVWPADRDLPAGWREEGKRGSREACLEHVDRVWTDMRPTSLRRSIEADGGEADPDASA